MDLFEYSAHEHSRSQASKARDEGIAKHFNTEIGRRYVAEARRVAVPIAMKKGWVDIDDVRDVLGPPPPECANTINGAVFKTKGFKSIGHFPGRRKESHGRSIARFKWVGA